MSDAKTYVFGGEGQSGSTASIISALSPLLQQKGIDPGVLAMMSGNNGWGNGSWIWILFLVLLWGNNGWGNGNGNGVASALNGDAGREMLMNAINGNGQAISQLATVLNTDIGNIQNAVGQIQLAVSSVGNAVGLSGQQVINSVQSGDAALSQQLCKCCCDSQLAVANQTSALQSGIFNAQSALQSGIVDNRFTNQIGQGNLQHSIDMMGSRDALSVAQQTNTLQSAGAANSQRIVDAINTLHVDMSREFCAAKERDLQSKIDTQGDLITQLRGQISNDAQSKSFTAAFNALQNQITALSGKVPNTVPVQYPNIIAANNTPNVGGWYGYSGGSYFG